MYTQTQQTLSSFFSPADAGTFLGMGWGGVITFMFLCTHRHSNLIIFLAVLQTQALLLADQLPVGWGGVITFMFLCTHRHTNHLGWSVTAGVGWGGVIMFMFLFTHRHTQPDHLSCSPADTGTTLGWSIGFYLGTLRPPTSWFAACKWWMMPVISCRLWII